MNDILRVFHHPALRDESIEIHRNMFNTVRKWVEEQPDAQNLNNILCSASVRAGRNHKTIGEKDVGHSHGALGGHGKTSGSIWSEIRSRDLGALEGSDGNPATSYLTSSPQPGSSPHQPPLSPNFGYQNVPPRPGSSHEMPHGEYLDPNLGHGHYQGGPSPSTYQHGFGGPHGGYQQAPVYPMEQPPYPGAFQGSPPPGFQGGLPPYGQGYPYPPGPPFGGYGY